jgi:hypothetical protein
VRVHFGDQDVDKVVVYEDEGFSGGNLNRPDFKKMMDAAQKRKIKAVIVYRLDRISHNISDFASLIEELARLDISVDVLGAPEPIPSEEYLDVNRYGVIVTSGARRGLLLPDLDGVDTPAQQVSIARRKAGIREGEHINLERFQVIRHH